MDWFWIAVQLAFAGLGRVVSHWSIGVIVIAVCLLVEFAGAWLASMVPLLKAPIEWLQKYVLYIAIATALILFGFAIGAADTAARCEAKAAIIDKGTDKAISKAQSPEGQARPDPWDNPEN
jgi:sulfite exporter TauE/SafE